MLEMKPDIESSFVSSEVSYLLENIVMLLVDIRGKSNECIMGTINYRYTYRRMAITGCYKSFA